MSGMIITPENLVAVEVNAENFPSCVAFFKFDEEDGATSLTEAISGAVFPLSTPATKSGQVLTVSTVANQAASSGSIAQNIGAGTSPLYCLFVGVSANGTGWSLGDTAAHYIGFSTSGANDLFHVTADSAVNINGTDITALATSGTVRWGGFRHDLIGGLITFDNAGTNNAISEKSAVAGALTGVTLANALTFTNMQCVGLALFKTSVGANLADYQPAFQWMANEWLAGNKVLWPYWKGRTL